MKIKLLLIVTTIILLFYPRVNFGQTPYLGVCSNFALFTAGGALSTDGATVITGDIASYTSTPTGFSGPGLVYGTIYPVGAASDPAFTDVSLAYTDLFDRVNDDIIGTPLETGTLTPGTIHPGVHRTVGAAALNGDLIFDGEGDPNALFIIQIRGAFEIASSINITLINEARFSNIYWQVNTWVNLGAATVFRGTIVAGGAITLLEGSSLHGRALTTAGAIELHNNMVIFVPGPAGAITGTATVCQGQSGVVYSVSEITDATDYIWTLPAGATISAGANTNSITVDFSASATSGVITVQGSNTYGTGTVSPDYAVTVNPATGATTFTAGAITVCQNAIDETYTATAANSTSIDYSVLPITAGVINITTGVMNWDATFIGTATITATSTGLCGTTTADREVIVDPATGATTFTAGAITVCQNAIDETYTATAANSTSIDYSVLPITAGVINITTGVMNWDAAFTGTATITATSTGLCGTTTADREVTVDLATGATIFTAGAITVCQNAIDETYTATAANSTSIDYSVLPLTAGVINVTTGVMNWDAAFNGTATITATSTGLCGTTTADREVVVDPATGATTFTAGAITVCQNAIDETYTATAANSTSIDYSVLPITAGVINVTTGVMNWDAAFTGTATITATSTGLCGTTTVDREVIVDPATGATTFTAGATTICQNAIDETYTATATNSTSIVYSVLPVAAGVINVTTGVMNWDEAFSGTATITATSTGLCGTTTADREVIVNTIPAGGGSIGADIVCQGQTGVLYSVPVIANATDYIWTLPPGATITAGANTNNITVDFNSSASSGVVTVQGSNICGIGPVSADFAVTVNSLPAVAGTIAGTAVICQGETGIIYTVPVISDATDYIWTLPAGATITAGANTNSITVDFSASAVSGNITVQGNNICGSGTISADFSVTLNSIPTAPTASTTVQPTCAISTGTIVVTAPLGAGYEYSIDGLNYQASATFSSVTANATYNVTVRNASSINCFSSATAVTVNAEPSAPVTATASTVIQPTCSTATGTIEVTSPLGAYEYNIDGGIYQASVTFAGIAAGSHTIFVRSTTDNTCISSATDVTVNAQPSLPVAPTASVTNQPTCVTTTGTIEITAPLGAGYEYSVDGINYQASSIFANLAANTSYNVTVRTSSDIACVSSAIVVTVNVVPSTPSAAGTITGTALICQGQTEVIYSVNVIGDATDYIWTLPAGATITAGANTNTITVDFNSSVANGIITVQGSSSCGEGTVSDDFAVTVNLLPGAAGTITGSAGCQ
ncbi:MAG: hypothetical protein A2275_16980 [Bacteroidetes bacterium RIFOXYA12_FULL_35_11]|nr:MAG: hypothetical protein A2X01_02285 [Bacteroidetes bacterium GWF2_35_48]OFY83491.1 MAG: hypothetical protein A2275_16980 [Bacteroidetes bacterium RIFOXYA12_FULL_35_11]OFY94171.1 MAG: hypothetical protein A2491_02245 [Bacteroidetes bacterium RIFOXYC12_FULL_35_7]HBX49446.1 hypothetical protein [Bacteroidales bacterium]